MQGCVSFDCLGRHICAMLPTTERELRAEIEGTVRPRGGSEEQK